MTGTQYGEAIERRIDAVRGDIAAWLEFAEELGWSAFLEYHPGKDRPALSIRQPDGEGHTDETCVLKTLWPGFEGRLREHLEKNRSDSADGL